MAPEEKSPTMLTRVSWRLGGQFAFKCNCIFTSLGQDSQWSICWNLVNSWKYLFLWLLKCPIVFIRLFFPSVYWCWRANSGFLELICWKQQPAASGNVPKRERGELIKTAQSSVPANHINGLKNIVILHTADRICRVAFFINKRDTFPSRHVQTLIPL